MLKSVFTFLTALLKAALLFWKQKHTPAAENNQRYDQIDSDIANRYSTAATLHADDDLAAVERKLRDKG